MPIQNLVITTIANQIVHCCRSLKQKSIRFETEVNTIWVSYNEDSIVIDQVPSKDSISIVKKIFEVVAILWVKTNGSEQNSGMQSDIERK